MKTEKQMTDKKPAYIDGVGWRYETEHRHTRRHRTHNYNAIGTYLITLTVEDRHPVFGYVDGNLSAPKGTANYAHLVPTELATRIRNQELPKIHNYYPMVKIWKAVLMPDHIHMIVRVEAPLPEGMHLGHVIRGFKAGCTKAWNTLSPSPVSSVSTDDNTPHLFEQGYNDRILMKDGQLESWMAYLDENPLRLLIRQRLPDIMSRALCLTLNGKRYSAYGNFMLLKRPDKMQVMCHRKATIALLTKEERLRYGYSNHTNMTEKTSVPYETTSAFEHERAAFTEAASMGTVLVTPGISKGEQIIKHDCLTHSLPLIHLQKEPITALWKPERERFYACARGTLLILAPWADDLEGTSEYEQFHNLNGLASSICEMNTLDARCSYTGMRSQT